MSEERQNQLISELKAKAQEAQREERKQTLIRDLKAKAQTMSKPKDSALEDFGEGLAVSGMKTYYGVKDLFGAMDDEDRATLKDWQDDASESGWGTAGQIVGDIGQTLLPGGAIAKGVKGLSKAKQLALGTRTAIDAGVAGALGATQIPDEGESRGTNAALGAAGAAVGGAAGKVLSKAFRGINPSDEALFLKERGVSMTPSFASREGSPIRAAETWMKDKGLLSKSTLKQQQKGQQSWNLAALKEAAAPGKAGNITDIGYKGNQQLLDGFNESYAEAWSKAGRPKAEGIVKVINGITRNAPRLSDGAQKVLSNTLDDIKGLTKNYTPERMRSLDRYLRKSITKSRRDGDFELEEQLRNVRSGIRDSVNKEGSKLLKKIDAKYGDYLAVRDAGRVGLDGQVTPQKLRKTVEAVTAKSGRNKSFIGSPTMQKFADAGLATVGRRDPQPILNMRKALVQQGLGVPGLGVGGRAVMGETALQKGGVGLSKALADALRKLNIDPEMISPGAITGGLSI